MTPEQAELLAHFLTAGVAILGFCPLAYVVGRDHGKAKGQRIADDRHEREAKREAAFEAEQKRRYHQLHEEAFAERRVRGIGARYDALTDDEVEILMDRERNQ